MDRNGLWRGIGPATRIPKHRLQRCVECHGAALKERVCRGAVPGPRGNPPDLREQSKRGLHAAAIQKLDGTCFPAGNFEEVSRA